eukprot:m.94576 g.94576  ORF g.94576 m.94576 type:complete len:242 (+) comp8924_c0_seq5:839-1564(+)
MVEFKLKRFFSNFKLKKSGSKGSGIVLKKAKSKGGDEQQLIRPKINDIMLKPKQMKQVGKTRSVDQLQPQRKPAQRRRDRRYSEEILRIETNENTAINITRINNAPKVTGQVQPRQSGTTNQGTITPHRQRIQQPPNRPPRPTSRDMAGMRRHSQLERQNASSSLLPLKPEFLSQIAIKPFSLSEKLKRWDHVTDFDRPVPPPEPTSHLSRNRQGSAYSGSSLMDWQTFAIKQARRRKTQV